MKQALRHRIFSHVEQVARLMADNPGLTVGSPEIKQHLGRLDDDVRSLLEEASQEGDHQAERAVKAARQLTRRKPDREHGQGHAHCPKTDPR